MLSVKLLVKTIKTFGCGSLFASFLLLLRSRSDFNEQPPRLVAQRQNSALWLDVNARIPAKKAKERFSSLLRISRKRPAHPPCPRGLGLEHEPRLRHDGFRGVVRFQVNEAQTRQDRTGVRPNHSAGSLSPETALANDFGPVCAKKGSPNHRSSSDREPVLEFAERYSKEISGWYWMQRRSPLYERRAELALGPSRSDSSSVDNLELFC